MNKEQVLLVTLRHGVVCAARPVSKENAIKEEREAAKRFINLVSGRQGNVTYADLHRYKNFSEVITIDEYGEEFTTRFQIVDLNDIKREYAF